MSRDLFFQKEEQIFTLLYEIETSKNSTTVSVKNGKCVQENLVNLPGLGLSFGFK